MKNIKHTLNNNWLQLGKIKPLRYRKGQMDFSIMKHCDDIIPKGMYGMRGFILKDK